MRWLSAPIGVALLSTLACAGGGSGTAESAATAGAAAQDTSLYFAPLPREDANILDSAMAALSRGDAEAFGATMTDSVVYMLPSGEVMNGRQSVVDYWKNRWTTLIKSLVYTDQALLAFNLTRTNTNNPLGKYVLMWVTGNTTYQNGKSITFPLHVAVHVDSTGRIDRFSGYYDTKGIADATASK